MTCVLMLVALVPAESTLEHTIPFELTDQNNMIVKALFNERDQSVLMFHTAVGSVSVTRKAPRRMRSLQFDQAARVSSWGGQSAPARFSSGNRLQIHRMAWEDVDIVEDLLSGRYTDGKFGPNLFDGKVLEINYDARELRVHSEVPEKVKSFERFEIERRNGSMFITATVPIDGTPVENQYMLHSGFGGSVLFDDEFAAKHQIIERLDVVGGRELRDSMGNVLKTQKVSIPTLALGRHVVKGLTAEVFPGAIRRQKMSIIGGDVLKRFNIVIDLRSNVLWLKPVSSE